jgi:site-specific DNA-cytosine methylase
LGLPGFRETWVDDGLANTLTGFDKGAVTRQTHLIGQGGRLRPPTITEWARLSGFPDEWLEGVGFSKGEMFDAYGDCFQPSKGRWLGERIKAELQPTP